MNVLKISSSNKKLSGIIHLPRSKSITNRALILNYILKNRVRIIYPSEADDSKLLTRLLDEISTSNNKGKIIELNCDNAGTVFRFLTAVLASSSGEWILNGSERMKERPIRILVDALQEMGAAIQYLEKDGYPPLRISGKKLKSTQLTMDASVSSQFFTAILLIAPLLNDDLEIILKNKPGSIPYLEMTIAMLNAAGINTSMKDAKITVRKSNPKQITFECEPDWSAAAFWFEMVALSDDAEIILKGLKKESLQGDAILPEIYKYLGVKTTFESNAILLTRSKSQILSYFEWDFNHQPDLAQAVIATCAGLNIPSKFIGLQSLVIKETDRLFAMQAELSKLGYQTKIIGPDTFEIYKCDDNFAHKTDIILNSWGDHRMLMSLAPLVLKHMNLKIKNPQVISKSYPDFWKHLMQIGLLIE
jgi:3-phosphoshikimate 1-carboxyvinyltransferase